MIFQKNKSMRMLAEKVYTRLIFAYGWKANQVTCKSLEFSWNCAITCLTMAFSTSTTTHGEKEWFIDIISFLHAHFILCLSFSLTYAVTSLCYMLLPLKNDIFSQVILKGQVIDLVHSSLNLIEISIFILSEVLPQVYCS